MVENQEAKRDRAVKNRVVVLEGGMVWIPPSDIDQECIKICTALNELPGIRTFESCCGHDEHGFWVWFEITDPTTKGLLTLPPIVISLECASPDSRP